MILEKKVIVEKGKAGRADLVVQELTGLPRAQVRGLFDHGCVLIDGQPSSQAGHEVKAGQTVKVRYDKDRRYKPKPAPRSRTFDLVYEDEQLLVVDKAAGFLTVPSPKKEQYTLIHELARYLSKGPRIRHRVFAAHRLEREASGLLVFGKTPGVASQLKSQFAVNGARREYAVLVAGEPREKKGTVKNMDRSGRFEESSPDFTESTYEVERKQGGVTLLRVNMVAGGGTQIRTYFAHIGNPVLGDFQNREATKRVADWPDKVLGIHASLLEFRHPATGQPVCFKARLPKAFRQALKKPVK